MYEIVELVPRCCVEVVAGARYKATIDWDGAIHLSGEDVASDAEKLVALLEGVLAFGVGCVEVVRVDHAELNPEVGCDGTSSRRVRSD